VTYRWPSVTDLLDLALEAPDTSARVDHGQEQWLLGACIAAHGMRHVWYLLSPGDFYDPLHGVIWAACLRLEHQGRLVEPLNVSEAVAAVPGAVDRVWDLHAQHTTGFEARPVMVLMAATIKRMAVMRGTAT
jgi:hypothetical protein